MRGGRWRRALSGGSGSTPGAPVRAGGGERRGGGESKAQQRACAAELSNQGRPRRQRGRVGAQPSAAPRRGARRGRRPDGPGLPRGAPAPRPRRPGADKGAAPARPGPPPPQLRAPRPGPAAPAGCPDGVRPGARGPRPPRMGKSNSKLKPEVVEELTRKTYCECARWDPRPAPPGAASVPSRPSPHARPPPPPARSAPPVSAPKGPAPREAATLPRPFPALPPNAPGPSEARGRAPSLTPGPIVLGHPLPPTPSPRAPRTSAACQRAPGHPREGRQAPAPSRPPPSRAVQKGRDGHERGAVGRGGGAR